MRVVLGIDAAWTRDRPSGVALVAEQSSGWSLIAAAPSYAAFEAMAGSRHGSGSDPGVARLVAVAAALAGSPVDLIAVDMPLARFCIVGRRPCDDLVARAYGGRGCGTHSPNASRPGRVGEELQRSLAGAGFPLRSDAVACPGVIEVYPHPALVELAGALQRIPYKVSRLQKYWPSVTPSERRARLVRQWDRIVALLDGEIAGAARGLPAPAPSAHHRELKGFEDTLDAVVCAWVGACALTGRARPFGDADAAIWVPQPSQPPRPAPVMPEPA